MNKQDLLDAITKIGTIEDDVERRSLLTNLSDEVTKVFDEQERLNTEITSLQDEVKTTSDKLTKAQAENYNLFKRVSSQKSSVEINNSSVGVKDEEKKKRSFDDLFKEGGDK